MNQPEVGKLITDKDAKRDAIHVAIAPVVAGQELRAAMHVYLKNGIALAHSYGLSRQSDTIGIVDPYIGKEDLKSGDRFYLFLYPETVSSVRHDWIHPAFPSDKFSYSKQWLENFATEYASEWSNWTYPDSDKEPKASSNYEALMMDLKSFVETGHIALARSEWLDLPRELWMHYENVTGEEVKYKAERLPCRC